MVQKRTILLIAMMMAMVLAQPGRASAMVPNRGAEEIGGRLRAWLQSASAASMEDAGHGRHPYRRQIARLYGQRRYRPLWTHSRGITQLGSTMMGILRDTEDPGAATTDDVWTHIDQIIEDSEIMVRTGIAFPADSLFHLEVLLTEMVIQHLAAAQFDAADTQQPQETPVVGQMNRQIDPEILEAFRQAFGPQIKPYLALQKSLAQYLTIQKIGGWPSIPEGGRLGMGVKDERVPLLRWRLVITDDLPLSQYSADTKLDQVLVQAIRRFQQRHGLEADGVVGPATLSALNMPVERRIDQLKLNMERWRCMPDDLGHRYLMVNIPAFELAVVEKERVVHTMRVIVGKKQRRTPVMTGRMTYLELNPYWNIPQRIARRDLLPRIQRDPGFLLRQKIEVFNGWGADALPLDPLKVDWQRYSERYLPLRLRQAPDAANALGKIKFMFPNGHSVYIHDTPGKSLFRRTQRSFSSGCVRVENPLKLAGYLLKDQDRDRQRLADKLQTLERQVIVLKDPVPVYLMYLTAWTDEAGTLHFADDLYSQDAVMSARLNGADGALSQWRRTHPG